MFLTARMHRIAVGLAPIVIGILTVAVQESATRHLDWWVVGNAIAAGALAAFINYLRGVADIPPMPLNPPKP